MSQLGGNDLTESPKPKYRYNWSSDGKRLKQLLDEGFKVICYNDRYERLAYGRKIEGKENEYYIGSTYVHTNTDELSGIDFIEPDKNNNK